jgi:hypothetical protein
MSYGPVARRLFNTCAPLGVAHVKNTRPHLQKLKDRSKPMIFMGYEAGSMAYHAYDPTTKRIHITRDVVFNEEAKWN